METNTEEVNKDYILSGEYRVVIHDDEINFEIFFFGRGYPFNEEVCRFLLALV